MKQTTYIVTAIEHDNEGLPQSVDKSRGEKESFTEISTKKATTIMPKEVFVALQQYCTLHDMPKHRVLYRFLIDGLHNAHVITDEEYRRFQDMAAQLTTTYEKK